jgi:hypothetical protein
MAHIHWVVRQNQQSEKHLVGHREAKNTRVRGSDPGAFRSLKVGDIIVGTSSSRDTLRMRQVQCLWCWISVSSMTVSEVPLTLVLMETYTTLIT